MRTATLVLCFSALLHAADDKNAILQRAAQALQAANFETACSELRPLSHRVTDDANVWNLLGICESELGRTDAARQAFERGLALTPHFPSLLENEGLLLFRIGDYKQAKTVLQRAISAGSANAGVAFSLAACKARTGDERGALSDLRALEPQLSNQAVYWTERAWIEMNLGDSSAAGSFDRAIALAPDDTRALNGAAQLAESQHEDEKALQLLLQAKKAHPDDVTTLLHLGSICLRRDLTVDAVENLKRAHELAPTNNLAVWLYARANITTQQWLRSHELFSEFDKRVPNYAPAQFALGWLDVKLNRPDEARGHLERALTLDPKLTDARYELGQLDLDEGRMADARRELDAVLAANAGHAKANIAMGDLLMKSGDFAGARKHYEVAIQADPNSGPAHYKLAMALTRLQDTEAAQREREIGTKLNAEAERASKNVLVLAEPDGSLLTGAPHDIWGDQKP